MPELVVMSMDLPLPPPPSLSMTVKISPAANVKLTVEQYFRHSVSQFQ
jgi:hypothetical protein